MRQAIISVGDGGRGGGGALFFKKIWANLKLSGTESFFFSNWTQIDHIILLSFLKIGCIFFLRRDNFCNFGQNILRHGEIIFGQIFFAPQTIFVSYGHTGDKGLSIKDVRG